MPDDQQNATSPEQRFVPTDRHRRPVRGCRRHLRDCWHFYPEADPADYEEHRARLAVDPTARVYPTASVAGGDADHPTLLDLPGGLEGSPTSEGHPARPPGSRAVRSALAALSGGVCGGSESARR